MAKTLAEKFRIKPKSVLLTLNAPPGFIKGLNRLPAGARIIEAGKATAGNGYDQVHWFVINRSQLEKELSKVMKMIQPGVIIWVYYPKGTSKIQTDLTRDKGWDCLLSEKEKLTWINLISFDETWSVFGFRTKNERDKKKELEPKPERKIFQWVNPATKEVKLPGDLAAAFKKAKKEAAYFDALAFTNKKEYLEWIVTAKRDETRAERIAGTIERLAKKWKNPRNI